MPFDISIVVLTICRESLMRAVQSVFRQTHQGPIQVLIGVDKDPDQRARELESRLAAECPPHVTLTWINPGYSTAKRNGGVHACAYGGALRSALTLLANSQYVSYLDDDDWLKENHVETVLKAISGKKWAFSYSIYADGVTGAELCVDEWESVGVGQGVYKNKFWGFVRPSGLTIDKLQLLHAVHVWSCSPTPKGDSEDRLFFEQIRKEPHACTGLATVCCALDPRDGMHALRVQYMRSKGVICTIGEKPESSR